MKNRNVGLICPIHQNTYYFNSDCIVISMKASEKTVTCIAYILSLFSDQLPNFMLCVSSWKREYAGKYNYVQGNTK